MAPLTGLQFRALGTEIKIISAAPDGESLRSFVARHESRFSRFLLNSELQQLCRADGCEFVASEEMFAVLSLAARFYQETGGIFDPLIRPQLEAAGYDRTFSAVPETSSGPVRHVRRDRASFAAVVLDPQRQSVVLPKGALIDLGGIAKGWIVDRLAERLTPHGAFLIDIGGDMTARGDGPDGGPGWLISIADPFLPERDICCLRLRDEAIATSTTMRRRWLRNGRWMHHIIDPRTGAPAESDLAQVSVVAPAAVEADVYAKTALILGAEEGLPWLRRRELPALLVGTTTGTLATPCFPRVETLMTA
jgi:thiamine biosynthesis lipoprotein